MPPALPVQAGPSPDPGLSRFRLSNIGVTQVGVYSEKKMVPVVGLEPTLLAELDFESSASTNFTTPASGSAYGAKGRKGQPGEPIIDHIWPLAVNGYRLGFRVLMADASIMSLIWEA
jgi:hypothetical protein